MPSKKSIKTIKQLIWFYFWLLIFEGALRKWVFPDLANPLLVVRDPVLIAIYYKMITARLFPRSGFVLSFIILAVLSFFISTFTRYANTAVILYGIRTNFAHILLIFMIPQVFDLDDVKKMGKWILILAMPISILMAMQFAAPSDGILNTGVKGDFIQIGSALGKTRPDGTFSFITGPAFFFPLVASFLLYGIFQKRIYPAWLVFASGTSLLLAMAVCGSRSLIAAVAVVILMLIPTFFIKPQLSSRILKFAIIGLIVLYAASFLAIAGEGMEVMMTRFIEGGGLKKGIIERFFNSFKDIFDVLIRVPLGGHGIGAGTNVGAKLITGQRGFLLAENEWHRIALESGLILGFFIILLRVFTTAYLLRKSVISVKENNLLPILLFGACALGIISDQFGQPTILGFVSLTGGLCLAACNLPQEPELPSENENSTSS